MRDNLRVKGLFLVKKVDLDLGRSIETLTRKFLILEKINNVKIVGFTK